MKTALVSFKTKSQEASEELRSALLQLSQLSKSEQGLEQYEVFQSEEDPLLYYVRESWIDQQAFDKHLNQPHLQEFFTKVTEWLQEPFKAVPITAIN